MQYNRGNHDSLCVAALLEQVPKNEHPQPVSIFGNSSVGRLTLSAKVGCAAKVVRVKTATRHLVWIRQDLFILKFMTYLPFWFAVLFDKVKQPRFAVKAAEELMYALGSHCVTKWIKYATYSLR